MTGNQKTFLVISSIIILAIGLNWYIMNKKLKEDIDSLGSGKPITEPVLMSLKTSKGALNNPGNIRKSSTVYQGEIDNINSEFKSFQSLAFGYRAMIQLLRNYYKQKKLFSLIEMLKVYAPSTDNNDPQSYAKSVSKLTGIPMTQDLGNIIYTPTIQKIIGAMSVVEQGHTFPINQLAIEQAYTMLNTTA